MEKDHQNSIKEAADKLELNRNLISKLIKDGTIPTTKVGKRRRIPDSVIQNLLKVTLQIVQNNAKCGK